MTIPQIEYFLTLANTLNYTKASEILHTTQPNLSRTIVSIEDEVGVKLFLRSKRIVKLTEAGVVFYNEMQKTVKQYKFAIETTQQTATGVYGSINLGCLGTALTSWLPEIVTQFREKYPSIRLQLTDYTYSMLLEKLKSQEIDAAIIPEQDLERLPDISKYFLFSDDMCVVMSKKHELATQNSIDFSSLIDEPFILMDRKIAIRDYELVINICAQQGFAPKVVYEANTLNNLLLMVECGVGVSILAKHMVKFATTNVSFVKLEGYENFFRMSCAWHKQSSPCTSKLIEIITKKKII